MGPEDEHVVVRELDHEDVVRPNDPDSFIYIASDELSERVADLMEYIAEYHADAMQRLLDSRKAG